MPGPVRGGWPGCLRQTGQSHGKYEALHDELVSPIKGDEERMQEREVQG